MRTLSKNKQKLKYALFNNVIEEYETDINDNIVYVEVDGEQIPVIKNKKTVYGDLVDFKANISTSGSGDVNVTEYGLDKGDYNAVILAGINQFPFDEKTLIFQTSDPLYDDDGYLRPESADYNIIAIKYSLNQVKYILKEVIK